MTTLVDHSGPIKVNQAFISSILDFFSGLHLEIENLSFQIPNSCNKYLRKSLNFEFDCWTL